MEIELQAEKIAQENELLADLNAEGTEGLTLEEMEDAPF